MATGVVSPILLRRRTFRSTLAASIGRRRNPNALHNRNVVCIPATCFVHLLNYDYRLSGLTYLDVLHIYGISRAGYIPQLFSIRLPNPEVIYELLKKANGAALIYDPSFESVLGDCHLPRHCVLKSTLVEDVPEKLPSIRDFQDLDVAFIFHTSGSTSGCPKLVPVNYRWLDSAVSKSHHINMPKNSSRQDVTVWM